MRQVTPQSAVTDDNSGTTSLSVCLFGHIARMDDSADAKRILTASSAEDWKRPPGRPRITWLTTVPQDFKSDNHTLTKAVNMAQNQPL